MQIYKKNEVVFDNAKLYYYLNSSGLMFKPRLKEKEAIILELDKESRIKSAIHMFFVFYPIHAIWLDKEKKVIDIKKVYPFQPISMPKSSAKYIIECCTMPKIKINDCLYFL